MFYGLMLKEAIHSVALEHRPGCDCDICKAAAGDLDALTRVWVDVDDALRAREEDRHG